MDYLGWELERQRAALAALLLGGGKLGDGASGRDGERRSPAAGLGRPETARRSGAESPGRCAGSSGEEVLGTRKAARKIGPGRRMAEAVEPPVSAWEEILGGETNNTAGAGETVQGCLGGGTGDQADYAGSLYRREMPGEARRGAGGGEDAAFPEVMSGGGHSARSGAAAGHPARMVRVRRGGDMVGTLGQEGLPVSRETRETGGTGPWGGGWGTAALRAEDGAKALSRAVQRDARRYDGGFHIY